MIDNSGSIRDNDPVGGNNWQLIIDFVKSIIDVLTVAPDAIRVAVIDFGMNNLLLLFTQHFRNNVHYQGHPKNLGRLLRRKPHLFLNDLTFFTKISTFFTMFYIKISF